MSGVFYYLVTQRACFDRLRREIDTAFPPDEGRDPFDTTKLAALPYLNAVMYAAHRFSSAAADAVAVAE